MGGGRLSDTLTKPDTHTSAVNGRPLEKGNKVAPLKAKDREVWKASVARC